MTVGGRFHPTTVCNSLYPMWCVSSTIWSSENFVTAYFNSQSEFYYQRISAHCDSFPGRNGLPAVPSLQALRPVIMVRSGIVTVPGTWLWIQGFYCKIFTVLMFVRRDNIVYVFPPDWNVWSAYNWHMGYNRVIITWYDHVVPRVMITWIIFYHVLISRDHTTWNITWWYIHVVIRGIITWCYHVVPSCGMITWYDHIHHVVRSRGNITWYHHMIPSRGTITHITWLHHVIPSRGSITWYHHHTHHVVPSRDTITWYHHVIPSPCFHYRRCAYMERCHHGMKSMRRRLVLFLSL